MAANESPHLTSSTASTVRGAAGTGASEPAGPNEAATKLAEAIDDFLGDLEKKFTGISSEILTKLDDMAERCDRLEQEMLLRDTTSIESSGKNNAGSATGSN